ncbi:MAG: helix-turn-helix domain-containing protein [Victivallaceae bacterium]|nr:helix-turn-helix domain-containing protein [Victivallaceae bacterium]
MRNETKMQVMDFIGFLETSGKLSENEHNKLRSALEPEAVRQEKTKLYPTVLTRTEVAKMLQVSTRTIDRMCDKGLIKFWNLGPRYIRFNLEDILALIQQKEPEEQS